MKTNKYIEQYIRAVNDQSDGKKREGALSFSKSDIHITPTHFNNFYFRVTLSGEFANLHIKEAKELAHWLLKVTEGLENDSFGINDEMEKEKYTIH